MRKPIISLRRIISNVIEAISKVINFVIFPVVYGILVAGVFYNIKLDILPNFFELGILSATIGGFLFLSGFLRNSNLSTKQIISKIGKKFLLAAVCFTVVGFTMPLATNVDKQIILGYYWIHIVNFLFIAGAAINLANGIANLLVFLWITRKD